MISHATHPESPGLLWVGVAAAGGVAAGAAAGAAAAPAAGITGAAAGT